MDTVNQTNITNVFKDPARLVKVLMCIVINVKIITFLLKLIISILDSVHQINVEMVITIENF